MAIKDIIGEGPHELLHYVLRHAFPSAAITSDHVEGLVQAMWRNHRPGFERLGIKPRESYSLERIEALVGKGLDWIDPPPPPRYDDHAIYTVRGFHHRTRTVQGYGPMESEFVGELPSARVRLPRSLREAKSAETPIGKIDFRNDHLVGSLEEVTRMFGSPEYLGYAPGRVDLITGARRMGTRFGPVSLFLGYQNESDSAPSFYILEGGTALGEPMVVYFSKTIGETPPYFSMFEPTPFSGKDHLYQACLEMDGDEPKQLRIWARYASRAEPYITITTHFERQAQPDPINEVEPWVFTIEAVLRSASLSAAMGVNNFTREGIQQTLAELGDQLDWVTKPHLGSGAPEAPPGLGSGSSIADGGAAGASASTAPAERVGAGIRSPTE